MQNSRQHIVTRNVNPMSTLLQFRLVLHASNKRLIQHPGDYNVAYRETSVEKWLVNKCLFYKKRTRSDNQLCVVFAVNSQPLHCLHFVY